MKKNLLLVFTLACFLANAQTFVSTSPENKNVILEEFTGISCVWCPAGHLIGQQMHDQNPNDVFLINIHTGGFASPQGPGTDFRTIFGDAIANQSNLSGYPAGTVNRHLFSMTQNGGTAMSRSDWTAAGNQILGQSSPVNVGVQSNVDMGTNTLTVDVEVYYTGSQTVSSNKLNVAIVQNNIEGPQTGGASNNPGSMLPNGNYNHQHMLRHMLTGQWGDPITNISAGDFYSNSYTWNIPADINGVAVDPTNIAVIAFVAEGNQEILSGTEVYPDLLFPNAYDAYLVSVSADDNICSEVAKGIQADIKNYGNLPLTTLDIEYSINGGAPFTFPWVGNLGPGQATTVTLSNYSYVGSATNTLNVSVSNPNGNTDQNTSNDSQSATFVNQSFGTIVSGISSGNATIDVTTDQYANETSWELIDDNGVIIASNGVLTNSSAQPTVTVNLDAGACYTFNMYDSYGDGIYPSAGGGFEVKDANGNIIVSNWNFTTSEDLTPFEVSGTSPCSGLNLAITSTTPATCALQDGTANTAVSGGSAPYTYAWNNGQTTMSAINLAGGAYSCTVTDANGCTSTNLAGVGIDNSSAPTSTSVATDLICFGVASGAIDLSISGGTPPYTYSWNNGATTEDLSNLSAGTYLVEYADGNGCAGYASITLTEPDPIDFQSATTNESGTNTSDGSITITVVSGGAGPYIYTVTGPNGYNASSQLNVFDNLSAGSYSVMVENGDGCNNIMTVTVGGGVTSVEETSLNLLVYPNPAKETLNVEGDYISLNIIDIYGKAVLSSNSIKTIDISSLSNGIYFVNINTKNGMIVNKISVKK